MKSTTTGTKKVVLAIVEDMLFASQIEEVAENLGTKVILMRKLEEPVDNKTFLTPKLIILDLNLRSGDALSVLSRLKDDPNLRGIPVIAFVSHVNQELMSKAHDLGADQVLPRSAFHKNLANILKRA